MANLTGNLKDSMTATFPREFDIPNAMTIQEIYDKLNARAAAFQMPFSVKGGIPGERVVFEKEPNLDVTIWLHVKDGTHIKITPVTQDSSAKNHGILIRDASNFRTLTPRHFRVAAQSKEENDTLINAIRQWTSIPHS